MKNNILKGLKSSFSHMAFHEATVDRKGCKTDHPCRKDRNEKGRPFVMLLGLTVRKGRMTATMHGRP